MPNSGSLLYPYPFPAAGRFEGAIVDADRFGVQRSTPEARDAFDIAVRVAGLSMTSLDLAPDMRFVRLSRLRVPASRRSGAKKARE